MKVMLEIRDPALTTFFKAVTHLGDVWVILGLCILIIILPNRLSIGVPVAIGTAIAAAIHTGLKLWIARPRPDAEYMLANVNDFSFPSGHSNIAIVFYLFLMILLRRLFKERDQGLSAGLVTVIFPLIFILVVFSRLYLGVHYLSDVAAGLCLGAFLLIIFLTIYDYLYPQNYRLGYETPDWNPIPRGRKANHKWRKPDPAKLRSQHVDVSKHRPWRRPSEHNPYVSGQTKDDTDK
jgi:membrane-associated phospholipid phosphatase